MKVILVLFLVCATNLKADEEPMALAFDPQACITNGNPADIADFPYQVGVSTQLTHIYFYSCGGSLISTTYVLTAAHCVDNGTVSDITVYLGSATKASGTVRPALEKIVHSNWVFPTPLNDIALIRIDAVTYSTNIRNVALPDMGSSSTYDGVEVTASGWGKTSDSSGAASSLQYADMKVIPNSACEEVYGPGLKASHICVDTTGGISICEGDSGGPLVVKTSKVLIGVASFVYVRDGCTLGFPAGFTRVTSYRQWIRDNSGV